MAEEQSSDQPTSGAESVFGEFLSRREAGEDLDFEAFCREHEEIAGALRLLHSIQEGGETETAGPQPSELGDAQFATRQVGTVDFDRIGPYRILEVIGEGGMGVVYRAEQTEPLRRPVALKLMKLGMDTREVIARFEAERQALAMMDHPNIAKVYDAGATPEGRPFFAMEYVPGIPITDHCDRLRLTTRDRLELFCQVCEAVQHAHQKAVIHRDLKPSNVLVLSRSGSGVVKVIDFGVAKALGQRLTERTLFTEQGQVIGTPEYMSPEQAVGSLQDIDTRTDVYSLGVLLYQLLSGALPFDSIELRRAGFAEIQRIICEEEPPAPSTRVSRLERDSTSVAGKRRTPYHLLLRELRGDLDWITMKALEKDPGRRYATPLDLAADIARHLEHEPVLASPPSRSYRAKKFLRRHRYAVAAVAAVAASLAIGLVASLVLGLRAEENARRAQENLEAARSAVDEYFTRISESTLLRVPGMQPLRKELLESALAYYRGFIEENQGDTALAFDVAAAYHRVGNIEGDIGSTDEAIRAYEQALAILARLTEDQPGNEDYELHRVRSYTRLGWAHAAAGRLDEARSFYRSAIRIGEALEREHPERAEYRYRQARGYLYLGLLEKNEPARSQAARSAFERAVSIASELVDMQFPGSDETLGSAFNGLGLLQTQPHVREFDEAIDNFKKAIDIREMLLKRELPPHERANALHNISGNYHNLGTAQRQKGLVDEALASFETALRRKEEVHQENPTVHEFSRDLAAHHLALGRLKGRIGRFNEAVEHQKKGIDLVRKLVAEDPAVVDYHMLLAEAYTDRAVVQRAFRELEQARSFLKQAIEVREDLRGRAEETLKRRVVRDLAENYNDMGRLQTYLRNRDDATVAYREAISLAEEIVNVDSRDTSAALMLAGSLCNLANSIGDREPKEAIRHYDRAVTLLEGVLEREDAPAHAQGLLRNSFRGRAIALGALGEHRRALADWDALAGSFEAGEVPAGILLSCALTRARDGDHARASAEAEDLARRPDTSADLLYNAACVLSLSAAAARADQKLAEADRRHRAQEYAARAMALLNEARGASFFDGARNIELIRTDPDLDALRSRSDFEELLSALDGRDETAREEARN